MPIMATTSHDEREQLLIFLRHARTAVKNAAYGLTDAQAAAAPTRSPLLVGGLVKHLTFVERGWMHDVRRDAGPATSDADESAYLNGFRMLPGETIAGLLADYDAAGAETDATISAIDDLDQEVPVPTGAPWLPTDISAWSVRWVVLHLIAETARHAGHADIVRESVDGAVAGSLLAAVEGWPASPWITPWSPADAVADGAMS